jgi:gliding motility-associated-like protein
MTNTLYTSNSALHSFKGLATLFAWVVMCVICLIPQDAFSTHVIGGDLRYRCLGNNLYEIRLTLRRDCFLGDPLAQFDDPASVGFFDGQTNQLLQFIGTNGQLFMPFRTDDTLNQEFISDCTISGNDVCVQQTTYVDTIALPFLASGYQLAYTRCCRNSSIQNIVEPLGTGMTLLTIISGEAQLTCNSSPELPPYPAIYICVNDSIDFDFGIESDPDGDSIVYELFSPFVGGSALFPKPQPPFPPPYDTVVWRDPPYSLDDLLGGIPLQIDRFTGHMTGMPSTDGQFLVGVRIFSYNLLGDLIEVTSREWQYNVRVCREVPEAKFSVSTELNCDNLTLTFVDSSENALDILWIFDYPNPDSETSTDPEVEYSYTEPGFYTAALIVTDEDSICFDTFMLDVGVFNSELSAEFEIDVVECGDSIVMAIVDLSIEPDLNFEVASWEWILVIGTDTIDFDTVQNPSFVIDSSAEDVSLTLRVFSENGCSAETTSTFDVNIIKIPFETVGVDTIGLCDGDTIFLFPFPGDSSFTYTWDPITGLDISDPFDPLAFPSETTTYSVSVTDGLCEVSGQIVVVVQDTPALSFVVETDCRSLEVEVTNTSIGGFLFVWDFGDGSPPLPGFDTTYTYDAPGNYLITLISADGCDVVTGEIITVAVILDSVDDTSISCFAESVELNPDGDDVLYNYEWFPSEGLSASDIANPTADVSATTTFYVTITDAANPLCSVVDSVTVIVPDDFDLDAPADSSYCGSPEITLSAGNSDLDYVWLDTNGDTLSTDGTIVVRPIVQTTYILTGVDDFGCSKTDSTTLSPTFFAYLVSPDVAICAGDDTIISIVNLDSTQDLTYFWSPPEFISGSNTVANPRVNPAVDQVFTVQIVNSTLGCTLDEQITVLVSQFDYTISGGEIICLNDKLTLSITNNDTTVLDFKWTPEESIVSGGDGPNPVVMPLETTTYKVQILNTDYGCLTEDSVTITVSWFDPDFLEIFSDPDTIIANSGEFFELWTNQDDDLTYMWTGPGIENPTLPRIKASPGVDDQLIYSVVVTNPDGCQLTGTLSNNLTVIDPDCNADGVFIPNAFSPNGDGENDVLQVYGNFISGMELHIFNRWGEEVFKSFSQNDSWDGTFEGELLTPGVYGYYLLVECPPDKEYATKGSIVLLR